MAPPTKEIAVFELSSDFFLILASAFVAGLVRGFSGFGSTLTFVPLSSGIIPPASAVILISLVDVFVAAPLIPKAIKHSEHRKVFVLAVGATVAIPAGAYLLATLGIAQLRWIISGMVVLFLAVLASGWRYSREPSVAGTLGIGAISGFMGGLSGFYGPAIALFLIGRDVPAKILRANMVMFLAWMIISAGSAYYYFGLLKIELFWQALVVAPTFGIGVLAGSRLFGRSTESGFRVAAYILIGLAAILSVPALDPYLR